jgi:hypothetical protein
MSDTHRKPEGYDDKAEERLWAEIDAVAIEIGKRWPRGLSGAEAVGQGRRRLEEIVQIADVKDAQP